MGWESSRRKEFFSADWSRVRAAVLERDGYRCQHVRADTGVKCGAPARQCDHISSGALSGSYDDSLDNLQALCDYHHLVKSKSEGGRARARARARRVKARRYEHPAFH